MSLSSDRMSLSEQVHINEVELLLFVIRINTYELTIIERVNSFKTITERSDRMSLSSNRISLSEQININEMELL